MHRSLTTKLYKYFSGLHTEQISQIMQNFKPQSQQQILKALTQIGKKKQYTQSSPLTQSFINKIQYFLLKKQKTLTNNTFKIYNILKQYNFITSRLKYGIFKNLTKQLQNMNNIGLELKNNQLEILLWFIYREYPFLRENKFVDIGNSYTLKLFQMHQFMNNSNKLPYWQPYIRISTMLKILGHQVQTRKDITKNQLILLNYNYYPYLVNIFKTKQQLIKYRRQQNLSQPLLIYLCNKYIDNDKIKYDKYIHYVQEIDNQVAHQQIQKIVDPLTWDGFVQLFQLYAVAMANIDLDINLAYKINQLFWRICQSNNVQLQPAIRLLDIYSKNQNLVNNQSLGMISRIKDAVQNTEILSFKFLPGYAFIVALNAIKNMPRLPDYLKEEFYYTMTKYVCQAFMWEQGEKQQVLGFFNQNKVKINQLTYKFLTDSQ